MSATLLVELLVDELPPTNLERLGQALAESLFAQLQGPDLRLAAADATVTSFAAPRRLAACITSVVKAAPPTTVSTRLMPTRVGLDVEGRPTPALSKRLLAMGESEECVPKLRRVRDGKEECLFLDQVQLGVTLEQGLQTALTHALAALPTPKTMSYQLADGISTVRFIRPLRGLVALHGADIVAVSALGLPAGRVTRGHRFQSKVVEISIQSADTYAAQLLEQGSVTASFSERKRSILKQISTALAKLGLRAEPEDALLDEVTGLVESPNVLIGEFDQEFLQIPPECLTLTMRTNQKCVPLFDGQRLTNRFLIIANIQPSDPTPVIVGNQRVVRARLADAKFFFEQDRLKTLESRVPGLKGIVYHSRLGTQAERSERVSAIAVAILELMGATDLSKSTTTAARLAKADLLTEMVGEFPELQGIMGSQYARLEGYAEDICFAIEDHYRPRFAGDSLPRQSVGVVLALADKLEVLVGMFGIGEIPTGNKDPFALRRQALGAIRILIERELPLDLNRLLSDAVRTFDGAISDPSTELSEFLYERLSYSLRDSGFTPQQVDAVLCMRPARLSDAVRRLAAVREFDALPEAASLAAANKRVNNILKKSETHAVCEVNGDLLLEAGERELVAALERVETEQAQALTSGDYVSSLRVVATLKGPVDAFFETVMVNTPDLVQRNNRLAILTRMSQVMNVVANISRLAT